jgi:hypothetical protein
VPIQTHVVRVSLKQSPKIWREIEVDSSASLYALAKAIVVDGFDFYFDHAFGFYPPLHDYLAAMPRYELFTDIGETPGGLGVEGVKTADAFTTPGQKMLFLFDYGDNWEFTVEFVRRGTAEKKFRKGRIIRTEGTAPPQYPDEEDE